MAESKAYKHEKTNKEENSMNIPAKLKYTRTHEWVQTLKDGTIRVGITDHAQDQLGDLVYINLPGEGDEVKAGEAFGDVESVKAVSDLFSPATGTVCAVNEALQDEPEQMNQAPYEAWIMEVKDITETEELLDAEAYRKLCEEEG
jgi:glycine cleavage system H protein